MKSYVLFTLFACFHFCVAIFIGAFKEPRDGIFNILVAIFFVLMAISEKIEH